MDRSLAREIAMKMLYAASLGGEESMNEVLEQSEQADTLSGSDKTFLENLVYGVQSHQEELDGVIEEHLRKNGIRVDGGKDLFGLLGSTGQKGSNNREKQDKMEAAVDGLRQKMGRLAVTLGVQQNEDIGIRREWKKKK